MNQQNKSNSLLAKTWCAMRMWFCLIAFILYAIVFAIPLVCYLLMPRGWCFGKTNNIFLK